MSNSYAKKFYLSPFGRIISFFLSSVGRLFTPFMIYGYYDQGSGRFRRLTRISSTAVLGDKAKIAIGDNCWIWHHSILDGSNGITIGKGVQIGAWVGIFTHSSHVAIRLHGDDYLKVDKSERIGYIRGSVIIGDYTFIGAGAKILPGVVIGKGCIISAGAIVSKHIPDYSIALGNPARVIGTVTDMDKDFFDIDYVKDHYFDKELLIKGQTASCKLE